MNIENIPEGISFKIMSEELFQAQLSNRRTRMITSSVFLIANSPLGKVHLIKINYQKPGLAPD